METYKSEKKEKQPKDNWATEGSGRGFLLLNIEIESLKSLKSEHLKEEGELMIIKDIRDIADLLLELVEG